MRVISYSDPVAFRAAVEPFLLADGPRHNLILGLAHVLIDDPQVYPTFRLWGVRSRGVTVGAALVTPPYLLVLAAGRDDAVRLLASDIAKDDERLPGVVGGLPEADVFAAAYTEAVGGRVSDRMDQAIYSLEAVADVPTPSGAPRSAGLGDIELVLDWYEAFNAEAGTGEPYDRKAARRRLQARFSGPSESGIRLWIDEAPVCLAGYVAPTPAGIRIGPVYTPPAYRRRGYATALVAAVSREMLARGHPRCLLYTDLANPTSNAIYRRIGYRMVCPAAMIRFEAPSPAEARGHA